MKIDVKLGTVTVPTSDTVTAGTVTEVLEGEFGNWVVQVPALEGTGTATVRMIDSLLGTLSEVVTNESTTALGTPTFQYYAGTLTITATTTNAGDGTQSAARDIVYNIYHRVKHG
jgi:hypothetical protein